MARRRFFRRRHRVRRFRRRARTLRRRVTHGRRRRFSRFRRIPLRSSGVAVVRRSSTRITLTPPPFPPGNVGDGSNFGFNLWVDLLNFHFNYTNAGNVGFSQVPWPDMIDYLQEYKNYRIRSFSVTFVPNGNVAFDGGAVMTAGPPSTVLNRFNSVPTLYWYYDRSPNATFLSTPDGAQYAGMYPITSTHGFMAYDINQIRVRHRRFTKPLRISVRHPSVSVPVVGSAPVVDPQDMEPLTSFNMERRAPWIPCSSCAFPPRLDTDVATYYSAVPHYGLKMLFNFPQALYSQYLDASSVLHQAPSLFYVQILYSIVVEFKDPW